MRLFIHEIRQSLRMLLAWSAVVGGMILLCMMMYPSMQGQMDQVGEMFASMGGFTQAFGLDRLNFGSAMGFYGVECGNILGLGGAFFSALLGVRALGGEESGHTAEFLLSHPLRRSRVALEKLLGVFFCILLLNLFALGLGALSFPLIGESADWRGFGLYHLAALFMQLQIGAMCFGISAFVRRGGLGIGLGLAVLLYFLNLLGNISDSLDFVGYITPFAYAEPADILGQHSLAWAKLWAGLGLGALCAGAGFARFERKDIAA